MKLSDRFSCDDESYAALREPELCCKADNVRLISKCSGSANGVISDSALSGTGLFCETGPRWYEYAYFGRDCNGPYRISCRETGAMSMEKDEIRPCDSDPKTRGCKSSCRGRSSDSSLPQRLPGRRRPVAKSVAGLSFMERGLSAASTVPDSHRIPYCPVRPADGNHDDAKIVFFRFVGAFRVQKRQKKPRTRRTQCPRRCPGRNRSGGRRCYFFSCSVGVKVLEKTRVGISSRKTAAFTEYSLSSAIGAV